MAVQNPHNITVFSWLILKSTKILLVTCSFFLFSPQNFAQVDPPNYSFTLEQLNLFFPEKPLAPIQKKWGLGKVVRETSFTQTFRFEISHMRYQFPVIVQIHRASQTVLDFYTSLPSYFLHDTFHQSLINRYGKQNRYLLRDRHAHYQWENHRNLRHFYGAACSITCFPLYYSVTLSHPPSDLVGYKPLIHTLRLQENR